MHTSGDGAGSEPASPRTLRRWQGYLAAERAEAAIYRSLAERRIGDERVILLALAEAESRHEDHWRTLLGDRADDAAKADARTRALGWMARRFGSVFVLALVQRAESRSPYADDVHATLTMAADEQIHEEVVRALATRGRTKISGTFRAAVFGANDGLVSNFALVLGIGATGVSQQTILVSGLTGLLAGALSMGAGEYVSVRSQRELLEVSTPDPATDQVAPQLDIDANELALVYRARGMAADEAQARARDVIKGRAASWSGPAQQSHETVGTGLSAAVSSFAFFASGALVPVLPYLLGLSGFVAVVVAAVLVGIALVITGTVVGLLSGGPLLTRAGRQLLIGFGAAGATYALGLLFGGTVG